MLGPADMSVWQGRIDSEEGSLGERWHQRVQALDLANGAGVGTGPAIALIGFACDAGVARNQGRVGAREGPKALRRMLASLPLRRCRRILDAGDIRCEARDGSDGLEAAQDELARALAQLLARGLFPIALGGGHEIALGTFGGLARHLVSRSSPHAIPRIGILNLDAHFDLRLAARANSGTAFRQIAEDCAARGWPFRYCCLGVSDFANTPALFERARQLGVTWRRDEEMDVHSLAATLSTLEDFIDGVDHLYLTVCLDVLPAAVAPGVSAPAARGVPLEVIETLLDRVLASGKLRVADVAELNPHLDIDGHTARVAARLVGRLAEGMCAAAPDTERGSGAFAARKVSAPCWDALWLNVHLATMTPEPDSELGEIRHGAIAVRDGRIAWLGRQERLPAGAVAGVEHDASGAWLTPGLIDCHTHLVHAGNRSDEFEARLEGLSYEEIARRGGGILSTVRATRAVDEAALYAASLPRAANLLAEGVTTLEIKSGYGLETDTEARMLRVARRLGQMLPVRVSTTFLGAHAVPPEYEGRSDDYVTLLCERMLPALAQDGLVDAVDAFCERVGFTPAQTERIFSAAERLGLPVKLHAEQLSEQGGAALVARHRGLSADHLEWLSPEGIAAMAGAGTVAVMLPGAFYFLREARLPPVQALQAAGVPIAVASDCNPGTSPMPSLLAAMNLACTLFRLPPKAVLTAVTRHAARALGLADHIGTLAVGKRADFALWEVDRPVDLVCTLGFNPCRQVVYGGQARPPSVLP